MMLKNLYILGPGPQLKVTRKRRPVVLNAAAPSILPASPIKINSGRWKEIQRGVTAPTGFKAAGISAKLRKNEGVPDLSVVCCEQPAITAGVFTQNILCAAPVLYDKDVLSRNSHIRAVLINAGQANAATGPAGYSDAETSAKELAQHLGIASDEVLVMSTGVIGHRIKMDNLINHIPELVSNMDSGTSADIATATAITTTDLVYKTAALELEIEGKQIKIGGMCKGSGMINPNMATLLGLLTCDAPVAPKTWKEMLVNAVDVSFNRITVDGDTSTNDTILAMTSSLAGIKEITDVESKSGSQLQEAIIALSQGLAKSVAWDGEGATCLIEISVDGARNDAEALTVAKSIANSSLTKSAIFGHDPNWGRIACAAGYSGLSSHNGKFHTDNAVGVNFSVKDLAIKLGDIDLMENGIPRDFDRSVASKYLKVHPSVPTILKVSVKQDVCSRRGTVEIKASIGNGPGSGMAWGCDLSYDYVRINAEYTT